MITLCLIVKNEENTLSRCLESAMKIVKEIIVVDTGSTDNTKEIALKYTEKIYDFTWCDDFSMARNFSISKASNDWILVLDADELITDYNIEDIQAFCKKGNEKVLGKLKIINKYEDKYGIKKYIERVNRIFNKKFFQYEGIIHEQITSKNKEKYVSQNIKLSVDHIGYSKEVLNRTNKIQRNINLLSRALRKDYKDPYLHYQLGKSYFMGKDYVKASKFFKKALPLVENFNYEYVEDLVESYGYSLIELNKFKDAFNLISYKRYYNNSPDFLFLIGLIYMNNGNLKEAAESFLKCTEFEEGNIEGINSWLPLYNIGVIFECLGLKKQAVDYYRLCEDYEPAANRIRNI